MRVGTLLIAISVGLISLYATIVVLKQGAVSANSRGAPPAEVPKPVGPEIAKDGPFPKAVAEDATYDFGAMEVGQEGKHSFEIRNTGEAALKLTKGTNTCKCTVSDIPESEIPPGGSTNIIVTYKPPTRSENFRQTAKILTNDPENKEIELVIHGNVTSRIAMLPADVWALNYVTDEKVASFTGTVFSSVIDKFEITGIESESPYVAGKATALPEERLTELKAKSGYSIEVTLKPGVPVGPFNFPLMIKTDIPENNPDGSSNSLLEFKVSIVGKREGPMRIWGPNWVEDQMLVGMGTFDASQGKKVTLNLFLSEAPEGGLKFSDVECDPKFLKFTVEEDTKIKGPTKRYLLNFEVPPGAPRSTYDKEQPAHVKAKTNHPIAKEVHFEVHFISF